MGWESLGDIYRYDAQQVEAERSRTPVDCPNHKYPLEQGRTPGQLHCVFGGEVFDTTGKPIFVF